MRKFAIVLTATLATLFAARRQKLFADRSGHRLPKKCASRRE
jgi:hypothetical protein